MAPWLVWMGRDFCRSPGVSTRRTGSPRVLVGQVTHQVWPAPWVAAKVRVSDGSRAIHPPHPPSPPPSSPAPWGPCFCSYGIATLASVSGTGTRGLPSPTLRAPGPRPPGAPLPRGHAHVRLRTEHQMKKRWSLSASLACAVSYFHLKYCRKISHL